MAYSIVTIYGMNQKIGNISFYDSKQSEYNFTKPYSEETARTIDQEVSKLVENAYLRTKDLLDAKINELEIVAKELLEKEIIFQSDLERLIGKRPFARQTTYEAFTNGTMEAKKEEKKAADKKKADAKKVKQNKEELKNKGEEEILDSATPEPEKE